MRRLLVVLLVVFGLFAAYVVIDLIAKGFVEGRVADEFVAADRPDVDDASFAIDSFPFLGRLAAFGEVSATLELEGVHQQGVTIDVFTLEVDGLTFDRASAFNGEVEATEVDEATATVTLTASTISDLVGLPVEIDGNGTVTAGGVTIQATMSGSDLVLQGDGFSPVTVPLDLGRFLPCDPATETLDNEVQLSCTTDELPPIVNRVLGEVTS